MVTVQNFEGTSKQMGSRTKVALGRKKSLEKVDKAIENRISSKVLRKAKKAL